MGSNDPGSKPPRRGDPPTRMAVALAAAVGVLGVYAAYYLRFTDTVHAFAERYGALGLLMGGGALLVLMVLAGAWVLFCEVTNLKVAFTAGLGFPGLVFGAGLAGGGAEERTVEPPAVVSGEPGRLRESIGLVFAPVRAVVQTTERTVEQRERTEFDAALEHAFRELQPSPDAAERVLRTAPSPRVERRLKESLDRARLHALDGARPAAPVEGLRRDLPLHRVPTNG